MPAGYAHTVYGQEVLKRLPQDMQEVIKKDLDLFVIGLQGPDILFYYRPLKENEVNRIGNQMHKETGREWFLRAIDIVDGIRGEDRTGDVTGLEPAQLRAAQEAYVYTLGVLCHFILDAECHGYINDYVVKSGISHYEIESELDRELFLRDHKSPFRSSRIPGFHESPLSAAVILPFYHLKSWDGIDEKVMFESLSSFVKFHKILLCPDDLKRNTIYAGLKLAGQYEKLHGHIINKNPKAGCFVSTQELIRRLEKAIPKGVRILQGFNPALVQSDPIFERNFLGE